MFSYFKNSLFYCCCCCWQQWTNECRYNECMPSRRSDGHRRWNNWDGDGMAVAIVWAVCIQEIVQWLFQSRCKVDSCAKTFNVRWPLCQGEIILLTLFFVLFFSFHMHLLAVCIIYMCLALDRQSQPMFSGIPVICVVISRTHTVFAFVRPKFRCSQM